MTAPSGILLLDKEPGMTSFDCIRRLKKAWGRKDLGHGGTLDRFASGLLPVLAGEGLKLARFFLESYPGLPTYWKSYEGVFELGRSTDTGDPEGAVLETKETGELDLARVQTAMSAFAGSAYEQLPPRYSAKKIGGNRASDLARAGREPELRPVRVELRSFECRGVESLPDGGYLVRFAVSCSKGTYVRSLATDLARELGTVGHVRELRRTAVGDFRVTSALRLSAVEEIGGAAISGMETATSFLKPFPLVASELEQLRVGKTDSVAARLSNSGLAPDVYCALASGHPAALFELAADRRVTFLRGLTASA